MGYYTRFTLDTIPDNWYDDILTIGGLKNINIITDNCFQNCIIEGESAKWYDHQDHMVKISLLYPEVVFILHGEGEESGDIWKEYYKDGEKVIAKAMYSFPDPPWWAR